LRFLNKAGRGWHLFEMVEERAALFWRFGGEGYSVRKVTLF